MRNCFYCGLPMATKHTTFREVLSWFGMVKGQHDSRKMHCWAKQTNEHLMRKVDGGPDERWNIVKAHAYCNHSRSERTPEQHKYLTLQALKNGSHPFSMMKGIQRETPPNTD